MGTKRATPGDVTVRRVTELPDGIDDLVDASADEDFGAVARLSHDWRGGRNRFDGSGEALFEARAASGPLVGVCGLNVDPYAPQGAKMGRVRHLYVLPSERRRRIATALVQAVVDEARGTFTSLRLRTDRSDADAFYAAMGFEHCSEAHATHRMPLGQVGRVAGGDHS